ncbi:MAG: hypothetical protein KBA31_05460 [Alphaproteobacteria bacterium]|nr:hypothetical protein [Alphaproteobacteria bacterium]
MRRSLLLASIAFAAITPVVLVTPPAQAGGLEWVDRRAKLQADAAQLTIRIHDYQLSRSYCRPTHPRDKTFDEVSLNQLEEELALLGTEFEAIKTGTLAATQGTSGGGITQDRLMTPGYPTYRGFDVRDDKHWVNMRRDTFDDARKLLAAKREKLAKAPEEFCGEPTKKTTGIIGSPPAQPVDEPVPAPTYAPINIPGRPTRFCSIDEKDAWLAPLAKQMEDAIENEKLAWGWAQALKRAMSKRRDNAALQALATTAIAQRDAYRDLNIKANRLYVDVRDNVPVEKCGGDTPKEVGVVPGNTGTSVGVGVGVGRISIPRRLYLALENAGELRLGAADTLRRETFAALFVTMMYDLDFLPKLNLAKVFGLGDSRSQRTRLTGELETYDVTLKSSGGSVVTTTEGLGIPGTGDPSHPSPAGYFLANPALNDVMDISQRYSTSYDGLHIAIEQEESCENMSGSLAIGGRFGRLETSDRFSGSIPGFGRGFAYQTDLETAIWGLFVATEAEVSLDNAWDGALRYAGEFSGFRVSAGARAGVNFVSADGTDRLDFTGFAPQSVRLSKDETTFSYQLKAGLHYTPPAAPGLDISISGVYNLDGIHNSVNRTGETGDSSQLKIENQEMYYGIVRTTFTF